MKYRLKSAISLLLAVILTAGMLSAAVPSAAAEQPESFGLPVISVCTDDPEAVITKEDKTPARVSLYSEEQTIEDAVIEIKGRGNSTWGAPKKPYQIKFDKKTSLFGLPKAKKWVLLANYFDRSLVRNYMASEMAGKICPGFSPSMRFVDLYLNGEYQGNYVLSEKVESGDGRIELSDGGFIVEADIHQDENHVFTSDNGILFSIKEPEYDPVTPDMDEDEAKEILEAVGEIRSKVQSVEDMIYAHDARCLDCIDVDSFIGWCIVNELFKNVDSTFYSSCYLHTGQDGKLVMGPIWDFDISLGKSNAAGMRNPEGFHTGAAKWYRELFRLPGFDRAYRERWSELRADGTLDSFFTLFRSATEQISLSAQKDGEIWTYDTTADSFGTPLLTAEMEYDYIRGFYARRLVWMDERLNDSADEAANVETLINGLPDCVVKSSKSYIDIVSEKYDALTAAQKNRLSPEAVKRYHSVLDKYNSLGGTAGISGLTVDPCIVHVNGTFTVGFVLDQELSAAASGGQLLLKNEKGAKMSYRNLRAHEILPDGAVRWSLDSSAGTGGDRTFIIEVGGQSCGFNVSIRPASTALPDRSGLSPLIERTKEFLKGKFNDDCFTELKNALESSSAIVRDPAATQTQLDTGAEMLGNALDAASTAIYAYLDTDRPTVGHLSEMTVNTPSSVPDVKALDVSGGGELELLSRTDADGRTEWKYSLRPTEAGQHKYSIYTGSPSGTYTDSGVTVGATVGDDTGEPAIYGFSSGRDSLVNGETLEMSALTSPAVGELKVTDGRGNVLPLLSCRSEYDGDDMKWSFSVRVDSKTKSLPLTLSCAGDDGVFSGDTRELSVEILPDEDTARVISASADSDFVHRGEPFSVTTYTTLNTRDIKVINEKGQKIGVSSKSVAVRNGMKKWTFSLNVSTEGRRTFTVLASGSDGEYTDYEGSFSVEVIPPESEVRVNSVEPSVRQAFKNEEFTLTVYTTKNAQKLRLTNESGNLISIKNAEASVEGWQKKWVVSTSIGSSGNRTLTVSCMGPNGKYSELSKTFNIAIVKELPEIRSVTAPDTDVFKNENFNITVYTNSTVESLRVLNENGAVIGIKSIVSTASGDGKKWTVTLNVGSSGSRTFTLSCMGTGGIWSPETKTFGVNVVTQLDDVRVIGAAATTARAAENQPFEVKVFTTTTANYVMIMNETGTRLGTTLVRVEPDGIYRKWTLSLKIGTAGDRKLTAAASPNNVEFSPHTRQFSITITK